MDLPRTEEEFVEALYTISETESSDIRAAAMKRLENSAEFRKANPNEYEAWRYLTHWYYVAIREMSTLAGFRADPKEIQAALIFLENAGFFRKNEDGTVEPALKFIQCSGGVFRLALGRFHREMPSLAVASIAEVKAKHRLLLGHTFVLSPDKYDQLCLILQDTIQKIEALGAGDQSTDSVYHVELAAFPLSTFGEKQAP